MRTSDAINELAAALAVAQASIKNAKLNKINPHFKSRYADLAEIRDTVTPALSANGIAVVHGMDTAENGIAVVTRLIHSSGQWVESRFPIAYDKPQTMGSAITYGRRYNLSAITNIAADDDDDANAANEKPIATKPKLDATASELNISGTAGASKAASRSLYERLISEMEKATSTKALEEWAALRSEDIKKLPADWMPQFREAYTFRRSSVASVQAA